jgi:hypothetical protein
MFKDIKELENFMIFCHVHYELNDAWFNKNNDKGVSFDGPHNSKNSKKEIREIFNSFWQTVN